MNHIKDNCNYVDPVSIFYIEGDQIFLRKAESHFWGLGFDFRSCFNVDDAIKILKINKFGAIISGDGLSFPGTLSLLRTVHADGDKTPFIIFSGEQDEKNIIELFNQGADYFLKKTGNPELQLPNLVNIIKQLVDERKKEDAIRSSEELYRSISENANDLIIIHEFTREHLPGRILYANKAAEETLNYSEDELKKLSIPDIIEPETPGETKRTADEIFEKRKTVFEKKLVGRDGRIIPSEVSITLSGEDGNYKGITIIRDITEKKDLINRLRMAIHGGELGTWDWNITSGAFIFNTRYAGMLGYSPDEIEKDISSWKKSIYPPDSDRVTKELDDHLKGTKEAFRTETRMVGKDGQIIWILVKGFVTARDRKGNPLRMVGTHHDITDIKESEEDLKRKNEELSAAEEELRQQLDELIRAHKELREKEAYVRAILNNIPVGIAVNSVRPEVKFEYFNKNFLKYYRVDEDALATPDSFWESVYTDPVFRENIKKRILEDSGSGDPERMHWENVPITHDGKETTYINARNVPLENKGLDISMVWDVTERKESEDRIKLHLSRTRSLLDLYQTAGGSEKDLMAHSLESIRSMTESPFGFIGLISPDESEIIFHSCPDEGQNRCSIKENPIHFPIASEGIWTECVKRREPVIINNYSKSHNFKSDFPEIRFEIKRLIATPIIDSGKIRAVLVVINKESKYEDEDTDALMNLGNLMWEIVKNKRAKESLRESSERFRAIVENLPRGVVHIIDQDFRYVFNAGPELGRAGLSDEMLRGKTIYEIFNPVNAGILESKLGHVFDTGETVSFNVNSQDQTFLSQMAPLRSSSGEIKTILELSINITPQKRAEDELRYEKELFKNIFESLEDAAFVLEEDPAIIKAANEAAVKIFGYSNDEMIGKNVSILHVDKDSLKEFNRHILPYVRENRKIPRFELRMKRKDGSVFPTEHSISTPFDYGKTNKGRVSIVRDITEMKESEIREKKALKQIEENMEQLATLNDQIRNPLMVITGVAEMNCPDSAEKILSQVKIIDEIVKMLDAGWIKSEKIWEYLRIHYGVGVEDNLLTGFESKK